MIQERVLTISTLLALVALSGVAHADLKIKGKSYSQTQPDWNSARAQAGAPPAQIVPEGYSSGQQKRCRFLGGPKQSIPQC